MSTKFYKIKFIKFQKKYELKFDNGISLLSRPGLH